MMIRFSFLPSHCSKTHSCPLVTPRQWHTKPNMGDLKTMRYMQLRETVAFPWCVCVF